MIIYLDDAVFPPSKSTLATAKTAGVVQIFSRPWPTQYLGLKSGVHEIQNPAVPDPPIMQDRPVTWGQLRMILMADPNLAFMASTVDTIAKGTSFPTIIVANNIKEQ